MKKLIFAFTIAAAAAVQATEMKVATVDVLVLLRNHPDYARNEKFMETKSQDLEEKGEAIKAEGEALQAEGRKLVEQLRNPMLNEKAKAEIEKKVQTIQQKLMEIEQHYRTEMMRGSQDLQDDRARLMKATSDDLKETLKVYAEKKGYDLILDTNIVAYAKDSFDVTKEVLAEMGVDSTKKDVSDKKEAPAKKTGSVKKEATDEGK